MRKTLSALIAFVVASAFLPSAHADRKSPLEGQPPERHKFELRKNRLEITPELVVSINQDFRHFIGGGAIIQYHIADWFGIAAMVAGGGGLDSGLTTNINSQLKDTVDDTNRPAFQPTKAQFNAHLATTNLLLSLYANVTPVAGKLSLFGALFLRYDMSIMAGIGFQNLTNTWGSFNPNADHSTKDPPDCTTGDTEQVPASCNPNNSGFKVSGMFGVNAHLYFNQWIGLNMEIRDFLNSMNAAGLDVNGDRIIDSHDNSVSNNLFVGVGVVIMLPTSAKISP